ncbi:unnamed protein product [Enterobius vermicularis]|uniref:Secreted protein n=1 Tax=Enterobius vermicularis TaxID=51028 RepID=A0A0N4VAZ2_ENTVE|nr:unnamed protein product [Enterobius vermicularis]
MLVFYVAIYVCRCCAVGGVDDDGDDDFYYFAGTDPALLLTNCSTDAGRALFSQVHRTQSFPTVMEKSGNEWLELLESGRVDKVESSGITEISVFSDLVFGCWLLVILDSVGYLETAVTIYRHLKFLGDSDGSGNGCDSGDKKVKGFGKALALLSFPK